jgi:hypothetical protein
MDMTFNAGHPILNSSKSVKYFQWHGPSLCASSNKIQLTSLSMYASQA